MKSGEKILIVEDERIIAGDIKSSLQELGYNVVAVAATGEEAIKKAGSKLPDLVLMDIILSGKINGIDAARQIISHHDIPVVYLTAHTDKEVLKHAKESGAYGYLVKPFKDSEMQATIELALYKHKTEIRLKQNESRLFTTLKSINDAVISTDNNGNITFMNPLAQSLTGWQLKDIINKKVHDIFKMKSIESHNNSDLTIDKIINERLTIEQKRTILQTRQGLDINVELSSAPITDEKKNMSGLVIIFRDITRRIQTEKELEDYREQLEHLAKERTAKLKLFSNIVEKSPDGIQILDMDGHILYSNQAVQDIYGFSSHELHGRHMNEMSNNPDFASEVIIPDIKEKGHWDGELNVKHKSGRSIPIWLAAFMVHDSLNQPLGIIGILRNLTERKLAENKLIKYQEQLEIQVRERTGELLKANASLQIEIIERKNVEHKLLEYQKQLQSLTSQLSLFEENEKRRIATELHDCVGQTLALTKIKLGLLNKSVESSEHQKSIREILDLIEQTIKETRTLTFELSPPILYELGLSQAVQWLIDQFREKYGLHVSLDDDFLHEPFDNNVRFFIFQAVRELLFNIIKHAQATEIKIAMLSADNNLKITVQDNGVGFTKPSVNNNGFGLFNIRERMNHIRGQFKIKSSPGQGTKVTLVAPYELKKTLH